MSAAFQTAFRNTFRKAHTNDQIPGVGRATSGPPPLDEFAISPQSSVRFLVETRRVHVALQQSLKQSKHQPLWKFRRFPVSRAQDIEKDLVRIRAVCGLPYGEDYELGYGPTMTPGTEYAGVLFDLAKRDPNGFLTHLYAIAFAHASGGHLIAQRIESGLNLSVPLLTYQTDPQLDLHGMRTSFFEHVGDLDADAREACLQEVQHAFDLSTAVLETLRDPESHVPDPEWFDA